MSTHNPMGTRRLTTNHYADRSQVATMSPDSRAFHESLPGYEVTPLRFAPTAAQRCQLITSPRIGPDSATIKSGQTENTANELISPICV